MMMSGKIDAIQQQYMYTVQPVKLFGDEKRAQKTKSSFDIYSQMNPKSLVGSILAWLARYNCQLMFCKKETSGQLIKDILYREGKEALLKLDQ